MVSKAQIERLHGRIDALEKTQHLQKEMCVVRLPVGWDEDRVREQHYKMYPEDRGAKLVVFIRRIFSDEHVRAEMASGFKPPVSRWPSPCDDEAWRVLARSEQKAGRDPFVSLRSPEASAGEQDLAPRASRRPDTRGSS